MIVHTKSYPRAGLIGNPSDGYFGKTIALLFRNYCAEVVLYETPDLEILPSTRDHSVFSSMGQLAKDVRTFGYYGGIRLLKGTVKRFHDYCTEKGIGLPERNFTLRYQSNIPHQVGLGGSSAIITASFRALCAFYGVEILNPVLANLVLAVEVDDLGISAGLQDRVVQVYEGMVYMDFDKAVMERDGYGRYEPLDLDLLPPIFLAYDASLAERSEVFHNNIRERFNRGEEAVVDAMRYWAGLTDEFRECLLKGEAGRLGDLMNANFDKRREIYRISPRNIRMVEAARALGASAKFAGSGGAIVGLYDGEAMYARLEDAFEPMDIRIVKPMLV